MPQGSQLDPKLMLPTMLGLHSRAQRWLMDMLLPGEEPGVIVPGAAGSCIVGTDQRALVLKAGTRFGAPFRNRSKAFEYESVIGVRFDTEASPAVVAIDAPHKIVSSRIYWADSRDDPWKARNAIPITSSFGLVMEQVVALRGLVDSYREHHPALSHPWEHGHPAAPVVRPFRPLREPDPERAVVAPLAVFTERCSHCRVELRAGWRFCPGCGAPAEPSRTGRRSGQ